MNKSKHKIKPGVISIIAISFIVIKLTTSSALGATYYVDYKLYIDSTVNYSIVNRSSDGTDGKAFNTLYKANHAVKAGDIVYIRGGTADYEIISVGALDSKSEGINPAASGTDATHMITYSVYGNEFVHLMGQADIGVSTSGIWIKEKSYIKITGKSLSQLKLSKMTIGLLIGPWPGNAATNVSSFNEISYVYIYDSYENEDWNHIYQGNVMGRYTSYNHIHHCKFEKHGYMLSKESGNIGNLFDLGIESADTINESSRYNVIENNEFLHAGHATFGMFGDHNVIRNNYFHNEGWYTYPEYPKDGTYGYRNVISDGVLGYVGYNIIENNRIGHAAPNYTWPNKPYYWGGTGMKLCTPYNIIRYNSYFNNSSNSLDLAKYSQVITAKADHNHIYNNTFFKNGYYLKLPGADYRYAEPVIFSYTGDDDWNVFNGTVLKNNLFHDNSNTRSGSYDVWDVSGGASLSDVQDPAKGNVTLINNFNANAGENIDPKFINEDVTDFASIVLPNLNLHPSSPVINGGTYLTQTKGSGSNSKNLIVDDAKYFQPSWGNGAGCGASVQADWIAIGKVSDTVQISFINYGTNTITLDSAKTWSDKAPVWLYKKSDGAVVLYGKAPDCGAHELLKPPTPEKGGKTENK